MINATISNTIKSVVHSFLPNAKILLFGSHARNEEKEGSDYDLLVIIPQSFPAQEKIKWRSHIHKALVKTLHLPFDVLLNSEEEIKEKKELPGHIIRWALKEGVLL